MIDRYSDGSTASSRRRGAFPAAAVRTRVEPMISRRPRTSWSVVVIAATFLTAGCHTTSHPFVVFILMRIST